MRDIEALVSELKENRFKQVVVSPISDRQSFATGQIVVVVGGTLML